MNILITGSTGFLGKHLSNKLKNLNHNVTEVSSKTIDLTNYELVKSKKITNKSNYEFLFLNKI